MQKVLTGLRNRGFVRVVETDPLRVVITGEGMAAIGAETEDEAPAAPDTDPKAADGGDPDEAPAAAADESSRPAIRPGTKQALMIDLMKRPEGATVEQIAARTQWQKHTIRGQFPARSRRNWA